MITETMIEAAEKPVEGLHTAHAAERAAPPNGEPSIMLKALRQWMKEMRGAVK